MEGKGLEKVRAREENFKGKGKQMGVEKEVEEKRTKRKGMRAKRKGEASGQGRKVCKVLK